MEETLYRLLPSSFNSTFLSSKSLVFPSSVSTVSVLLPTRAAAMREKRVEKLPPSRSSNKTHLQNPSIHPRSAEKTRVMKTHNMNPEISPHRAVAAVRLLRIEQGGAFAGLLNEKVENSGEKEMGYVERTLGFRTRKLEDRDLRLVTNIVGGTVRWRRYLDYLIMALCNDDATFRGMEPLLLQILRIGAYEIIKLGTPPYAAIDENVKLAKTALRPGAGSMVNGILRKLVSLQETDSLPCPEVEGDDRSQARALAIIYSHPVWMVRRWIKSIGKDGAIQLMDWNNRDPIYSLRVNTSKGLTRDDFAARLQALKVPFDKSQHMKDFLRVSTGMQAIIQAGFLKEGLCSVQDESAGFVVSLLDPRPGESIIDCCAAPGGKALFIASCLKGQGKIFAMDVNTGRLRILEETAELLNVGNVVETIHADLRAFARNSSFKMDKVLVDVPCSGLGVLSKRADLRWNRMFEDLQELKNLQDELLDAASKLVKSGGILVYGTCSIDSEENEDRIAAFLLRHPEFVIDHAGAYVPLEFVTEEGFYFSHPVKHRLDGAFAARLIRPYLIMYCEVPGRSVIHHDAILSGWHHLIAPKTPSWNSENKEVELKPGCAKPHEGGNQ